MTILKTGACFTAELELNCPTIVACVAALPTGAPAVAGDLVLGPDSQYHALPAPAVAVAPTLSIAGDQLTISGGNTVTLPDADTQDLSIAGNVISLTNGGSVTLPTAVAPAPQVISLAGDVLSLSGGGGSVTLPDLDTQDISISGNVISLTNGGSITLPAVSSVTYPASTPCELPTTVYGELGGVAKQFDLSAIASTAIAVQTPAGFNVLAVGSVQTSQINNPSTCRAMLVTAIAEYSLDYPQFGHGDTHLYYDLNTTGFGAVNTLPAQYHDNNGFAGGTNLTMYRTIVVPPGGSAYFSTRTEYGAGNASITSLYNHFLTGVTV